MKYLVTYKDSNPVVVIARKNDIRDIIGKAIEHMPEEASVPYPKAAQMHQVARRKNDKSATTKDLFSWMKWDQGMDFYLPAQCFARMDDFAFRPVPPATIAGKVDGKLRTRRYVSTIRRDSR